jgi:hypothetical protein
MMIQIQVTLVEAALSYQRNTSVAMVVVVGKDTLYQGAGSELIASILLGQTSHRDKDMARCSREFLAEEA